jgi:hypothetical protein
MKSDVNWAHLFFLCFLLYAVKQSLLLLAMLKGCGSLADGQTCSHNHLGIRHDCAMFLSGRLLAVLTEDYDLCLITWTVRNRSETCEIEGHGDLVCLLWKASTCRIRMLFWKSSSQFFSIVTNTPAWESSLAGCDYRVCIVLFKACICGTIVTWLILPVVICLSQRLSHACLSINKFVLW